MPPVVGKLEVARDDASRRNRVAKGRSDFRTKLLAWMARLRTQAESTQGEVEKHSGMVHAAEIDIESIGTSIRVRRFLRHTFEVRVQEVKSESDEEELEFGDPEELNKQIRVQ